MRNESEWKITEDACEAIIPLDLWHNAQAKLSQHQPRGTQKSPYLLTGMIKCGHCKSSMVSSRSRTNRKGEYKHIYLCSKYRQGQGCFCNWVAMDDIDPLILETVIELLKEKNELEIKDNTISINVEALTEELGKLNNAIDFQLQLLEMKEISLEEFRIARQRINKNKEKIENQLKSVNASNQIKLISVNDILPILQNDNCNKEEKREELKKYIESIFIFDKGKTSPIIDFKKIE